MPTSTFLAEFKQQGCLEEKAFRLGLSESLSLILSVL
jgi:hypothetical protein